MNLNNIIDGRLPISLPHLSGLILRIPTKLDIMKYQYIIDTICDETKKSYDKAGFKYHDMDAEKDLLTKHPDFYKVIAESEKHKKDIILSLDFNDNPDERFMKTPDEVQKMSEEERSKYEQYVSSQYSGLYDKFIEDKVIKEALEYAQDKVELYSKTIETYLTEMKRVYWLVFTAANKDNKNYFDDINVGTEKVLKLPYPEYTQLMNTWNGLLDGFGLPF